MRWRPALLLTAAVVLLAAAGAVTVRASTRKATVPTLHLSATAEQWRVHEVNRQLAIALHNNGDVPVRVTRVEPVLPSFDGEATVGTDALLPVGGLRVDVPVSYGTGTCVPTAAASHVVVTAHPEGSAATQRITIPLPDPNPLLDRLLAADCATQRIQRSVTLRFGPWTDAGAAGLRGDLVVERTAAATGTVQVRELDGNVMYRLELPSAVPLAEVTAAQPTVSVPLTARPARCDAHALAEIKKPFEFLATVTLEGGDPLVTAVPVSDDDKAALDRMLRRICKLPG
ncbi:hypothetical protein [Actinoplanes regularis]|uniref:Uncharacterized protein n=1 Tax=Actinoplanes regularis TaxID=52697 RepID=A0A239E835_9ACTN|nr:hypothetical protein [Actinoplanes regularis]GIE89290.1 hypothetical protein Are01nite_57700 [Actinoplanes regularis]SNS40153.1 hypothetical protein SAMN06264365_11523 [Actinoplanes regularis]